MVISVTPLRFSLMGGGSDQPGYFNIYGPCKIVSMALDAHIYVTMTERALYPAQAAKQVFGHNIRLSYMKTETVDTRDELEHDLIKAALQYVSDKKGCPVTFEMTTIGEVPSRGAGLGSSSALLVGVLKLFYPRENVLKLAYRAAEIEMQMLNRPVGIQDHLSAAFGGLHQYTVMSMHPIDFRYRPMHSARATEFAGWLIAFRLPADRSPDFVQSADHNTLRDLRAHLPARAPYIEKTVAMVDRAWGLIQRGEFARLAPLMQKAWEFKLLSHGVVDNQITEWYNTGITAGALAGKVSGSMTAGTGHLFFLCAPDKQAQVLAAMPPELAPMHVRFCPHGSHLLSV